MTLPPVLRALYVERSPAAAFDLFTRSIGAWWPLVSHGVFGASAADVVFGDGRLVERAVDGRETVWGEVLAWEPASRLVLTWHPGADTAPAGRVEVFFLPDGGGTRVELVHSGWEAFGADASARRGSYDGRRAWGSVLDHLADLAGRTATGAGWAAFDAEALRATYTAFYDEVVAGGFGDPPAGEWTARQVAAHIAVNDGVLAAVTRCLLADQSAALDNVVSTDAAVLDAWVARHDTLDALAAAGRERSELLVGLLSRLDEREAATAVPARLAHAGTVVVDEPLPWARIVAIQLGGHLPGHTAQLQALRPTAT